MEADTATVGRIDRVLQQVIDVDQPTQQQQQPCTLEANGLLRITEKQPRYQRGNGDVQQNMDDGAEAHANLRMIEFGLMGRLTMKLSDRIAAHTDKSKSRRRTI